MKTRMSAAVDQSVSAPVAPPGRWEKKERLWVALLLAAFLASGIFFIKPYMTGSDQVSYITIAQKYARGQFDQAVNGYWSPLFSWLLAPLLWVRIEPVVAYKLLTLLASAFLLISFHLLSRRFSLTFPWRMIALLAFAPSLFFCFYLIDNGPDILVTGLIVCYVFVLFDPRYLARKHSWLWCGLFGALAYLAKSYAFFFFLGHVLVFHLYLFIVSGRGPERKKTIGRFLAVLAFFFCLSGAWIAAVSLKYHKPTFNASSKIIFSLIGPYSKDPGAHPMMTGGLFPPPNPTAVNAWEDPAAYIRLYRSWSPFQSGRDFAFWFRIMQVNFKVVLKVFANFSPLFPIILLAGLILAFFPRRHRVLFLSWPTLFFYTSGYVALFVIERYLIFDLILIILIGAYLLNLLSRARNRATRASVTLLTAAFLISFFLLPYQYSALFRDGRKKFFITFGFTDIDLYRLSRTLRFRFRIPPGAKIASNVHYSPTLILAYYLGLKYYGNMTSYGASPENQSELRKSGIDFVFYWSQDKLKDYFLASYREITRGKTRPLWVYSLKERAAFQHQP
ncbi:MAG: hypothetical protein MUP19_02845 [Candidatus Aminicenantes bacterium]|nr:hypothetical protein [Candidatus Aminicenantes bacterium]